MPRGGGRGRGFPSPLRNTRHDSDPHSAVHTGSTTPVAGLGYHKEKQVKRSTVGDPRGTTIWGGGDAPLFVKAGDLFKDGTVEVITLDRSSPCSYHMKEEFS